MHAWSRLCCCWSFVGALPKPRAPHCLHSKRFPASYTSTNPHTDHSLQSVSGVEPRNWGRRNGHRCEALREVLLIPHRSAWSEQLYMREGLPEPAWNASAHRLLSSATSAYLLVWRPLRSLVDPFVRIQLRTFRSPRQARLWLVGGSVEWWSLQKKTDSKSREND